jgi:hypothetical protein
MRMSPVALSAMATTGGVVAHHGATRGNRGNNACCSGRLSHRHAKRGDGTHATADSTRSHARAFTFGRALGGRVESARGAGAGGGGGGGGGGSMRGGLRGLQINARAGGAGSSGGAGGSGKDFYRLLEITPAADGKEVKRAFRKAGLSPFPTLLCSQTPVDDTQHGPLATPGSDNPEGVWSKSTAGLVHVANLTPWGRDNPTPRRR